jgi:NAD(P)-dependent dehydrogenase (short-subunit alcohol dehydrogenase family)
VFRPLKPIHQQVVVVVGASSGIGRLTALRFAERGAKVVVSARSREPLESLVEEIREVGGEAVAIPAEVTEFEQVSALAEGAAAIAGRIDTWVHVAGVGLWASFDETTPEEFRRVIDVNLLGQIYGAKAALPHLKRQGRGALIHVSSVEAKLALPFQSAYAASKHGMDGFLEALRMELQHEGWPISVTQVLPSSINTPIYNKGRTRLGVVPRPMPPVYQPGVVAAVILYAAEHPTRDIVAGGAGKLLLLGQRLSPPLVDAVLQRIGFHSQHTLVPRTSRSPDNLCQYVPGWDRVRGVFHREARRTSTWTWLETHPRVKGALLLGAAALLAARALRRRDR